MSFVRLAIMKNPKMIVILGAFLSSCGTSGHGLGSDDKFSSSNKDAVLIFGFNFANASWHSYNLHIDKVDPKTLKPAPTEGSEIVVAANFLTSLSDVADPQYNVLKVPAGTYAVHSATGSYGSGSNFHYVTIRMRPKSWMFDVKPGDVVYVGNFTMNVKLRFLKSPKIKLQYQEGQLADVKQYLSKRYKNIATEVVDRAAQVIEVQLPVAQ